MNVSEAGRALIARNEGCVLHAYPDPASGGEPWTIGYGHTAGVRPGQRITQAQADQMLADDLARVYGPAVQAAIGDAPTTQAQFDAMVSLAFNIGIGQKGGEGGFVNSSICRMHKAGNYQAAAEAFGLYNRAAGRELPALTRRRREEADLYLSQSPIISGTPTGEADGMPNAISPIDKIKAIQLVLGVEQDGAFGRRSRASLNAVLTAAGQPGI
jgi:lysozyme